MEALDRYGTLFVDFRGEVPACAGFEMFEMLRKLLHGLLVGAFVGRRRAPAAAADCCCCCCCCR
jgi:hypothetical protein